MAPELLRVRSRVLLVLGLALSCLLLPAERVAAGGPPAGIASPGDVLPFIAGLGDVQDVIFDNRAKCGDPLGGPIEYHWAVAPLTPDAGANMTGDTASFSITVPDSPGFVFTIDVSVSATCGVISAYSANMQFGPYTVGTGSTPGPSPPGDPGVLPQCPTGTAAFSTIAQVDACALPPRRRDPCVTPNRKFGGKTPAERAYYKELALAFNENAWDGQELAERTDAVGILLDALLKAILREDGSLDPAAPAIAAIEASFDVESTLVDKRQALEIDRKLATDALEAAQLRRTAATRSIIETDQKLAELMKRKKQGRRVSGRPKLLEQRAQAVAARDLANMDVAREADEIRRVRNAARAVDSELTGVRRGLGQRLRDLERLLPKTVLTKAFTKVIGFLNPTQDAGALWVATNSALAAWFNIQAKPPPGCNEAWTSRLPKRAGVGPSSVAHSPAVRALPASFTPIASAVVRPVVPGTFISRRQAAAFARVTDSLTEQLATTQAVELEMKRSGDSPSPGFRPLVRKLSRLLRQAPARYRALASAVAFQPVPMTAEAVAAYRSPPVLARLRKTLKRLGAPRAVISQVSEPLAAIEPGDLVDPFAMLRDPALAELSRTAADALAAIR